MKSFIYSTKIFFLLLAALSSRNNTIAQCVSPVITAIGNSGPVCEGGTLQLSASGTINGVSSSYVRMAGIGGNFGNRAFDQVFAYGDRPGAITRISNASFDAIFASAANDADRAALIKAQYDVIMFTWASPEDVNITWGLITAYLNTGGSVFVDGDYQNVDNLYDGTSSSVRGMADATTGGCNYTLVSPAPFPVLVANGVTGCFDNDHLSVISFPSWMQSYIKVGSKNLAVAGIYPNGNHGRLIVQGPDQDYHAQKFGDATDRNQYQIILNQMDFLTANQAGFSWTGPNGFVSNEANPIITSVTAANAGTYTVTLTNVTGGGCSVSATTDVVVNLKPAVQCPSNIIVNSDPGTCGSIVSFPSATITNGVTGSITYSKNSNTLFPIGVTTVTATASNSCGSTSCTFTVTVNDIAPTPDVTNLPDLTGECSLTISNFPTATDNCNGTITATTNDPLTYSEQGDYVVHWKYTDGNGNVTTQLQNVKIQDVTPPSVTCPPPVTISCDASALPANTGTATSTDNCSGTSVSSYTDVSTQDPDVTHFGHYNYTITRTWKVRDAAINESTCNQLITVQDIAAPTAKCKSIERYLELNGTVSITANDINDGSGDNCGPVNLSIDKSSFNTSNVGDNTVTLTVTDMSGNSSTCQATVKIKKRPTLLVYTGDGSEQYSDQQSLTATLTDKLTGTPLTSKTVSFTIGSQTASDGPNAPGNGTDASGIASTSLVLTQDPAPVYTVKSNFAGDATFLPSSDEDAFDIWQEDARAYYSGALFASTSGVNSSSATVTLSATIKDIAAVTGDPAYDAFKGDIRNASVTFINRDNNTVLAANVPVGLVNLADITVGTATKNVAIDIGSADAKQLTIGIIVDNYYIRNASTDNTVVTVSKPLDNFITGGGYIVLTNKSAGQKAGTQGTNNNFGFNVKFNKSNTNLQGNINTIIRRMEIDGILHVYQIKGNSMTSLAVNSAVTSAKAATFNGKANIQDITNPLLPVSVDGNATLQVTMTDKGEPGNTDDIGITVWNKSGGLWYSSNWSGAKTINQTLGGGNIKVNGASYNVGTSSTVTLKTNAEPMEIATDRLSVQAYPNPTAYAFTISVKSNDRKEKITLKILDVNGRLIGMKTNLVAGQTVLIGEGYRPGTYVVEAMQGKQKASVKLVKIPE